MPTRTRLFFVCLFLIGSAMQGAAQESANPISLAIQGEEILLQQDYQNRISAFVTKITRSTDFQVTVDIELGISSSEQTPTSPVVADTTKTMDEFLPGFQLPHIKSVLELSLDEGTIPVDEPANRQLQQAAQSPIDIQRMIIKVLLDESIATDVTIQTIEEYVTDIVPFRLSRGDKLVISTLDFSQTARPQNDPSNASAIPSTTNESVILIAGFAVVGLLLVIMLLILLSLRNKLSVSKPADSKTTRSHPVSDKSKPMARRPEPVFQDTNHPFSFLNQLDKAKQVALLSEEPPRIIARVLAFLPPREAGQLFAQFPEDKRREISEKLLLLQGLRKDALEEIRQGLEKKVQMYLSADFVPAGGIGSLSEIVSWASEDITLETLEHVKKHNHDQALEFSQKIFTFDKLIHLEDSFIKELNRSISLKHLAMALENASPDLTDKFRSNMTPDQIKELDKLHADLESISTKNVKVTRAEILETAKKMLLERDVELSLISQ